MPLASVCQLISDKLICCSKVALGGKTAAPGRSQYKKLLVSCRAQSVKTFIQDLSAIFSDYRYQFLQILQIF